MGRSGISEVVKLQDLPMQVWKQGHKLASISVVESPYYLSLQRNDPAIFEAYQKVMRGLPSAPSEITWSQFLDLRDDIAVNGLRDMGSPITLYSKGQLDGHHRLAILCHLYGPTAEVLVSDNVVTFPAPPVAGRWWDRMRLPRYSPRRTASGGGTQPAPSRRWWEIPTPKDASRASEQRLLR